MRRHWFMFVGVWLVALLAAVSPRTVDAQESPEEGEASSVESEESSSDEADEASLDFGALVEKGQKAFANEKWQVAADAFERAYQMNAEPNLLYNIGRAYESAGEFETAITYFEKFANQAGVEMQSRKDALERIETLREVVALRRQGEEVDEEKVKSETSDRELADADGEAESARESNFLPAGILTGIGGASLATGTVFAVLTTSVHEDFQSAQTLDARRSASEQGSTYALLADGLLISGGAITAVGLALAIWPPQTRKAAAERPRVTPMATRGGAGVSIDFDF